MRAQSVFRTELLARAWTEFRAALKAAWRKAAAVARGAGVFAVCAAGALALFVGQVALWFAVLTLTPPDGHALGSHMAANNLAQLPGGKVIREAMYVLANQIGYMGLVSTKYNSEYADYRAGQQITVKKPPRYVGRRGAAAQVEGITQPTVVVTVQPEFGIDLAPSQTDLALLLGNNVNEWMDEVGTPAISQLAATIDLEIAKSIRDQSPNLIGTPGTRPRTLDDVLAVKRRLDEWAVPGSRKGIILGPNAHANLMGGLTGNFVTRIIDPAEIDADLQDVPIAGFKGGIIMSQSAPARTVGVYSGAPLVSGAGQSGASLATNGWGAGSILKKGDVIHLANVFYVNPQTRLSTSTLAQFCVTADATADAGGNMTIAIYPALNPPVGGLPAQFQTVDSFPAAGAAVTVDSGSSGVTYQEGAAFEERAVGMITIPMFIPKDAHVAHMVQHEGLGMRLWVGSDITNGRQIARLDVLAAFPVFYPEATVRVTS